MADEGRRGIRRVGPERILRFADFQFHPESGELFRGGRRVALGPKPTLILAALLERAGRLVERDHLYDVAWSETIVEYDQGLNSCLRQIRRALGDDARAPRFVETVPRRGYRFVAPLDEVEARWMACPKPPGRPPRRAVLRVALAVGFAAVFAMGLAGAHRLATSGPTPRLLARVDFDLASEDSSFVGLDRRLERQVRQNLDRLTAGTGTHPTRESFYVTGTLRPEGDGAHLRALLVRASDGRIVWSGSFDPLCPRGPADPEAFIGAYIARRILEA